MSKKTKISEETKAKISEIESKLLYPELKTGKTPKELFHEIYLDFRQYMKSNYNYSMNEGEFNLLTYLIKTDLLIKVSLAVLTQQEDQLKNELSGKSA